MKKDNINDEPGKISPLLDELKARGEGFNLPENYFGEMEKSLFARIEAAGPLERPVLKIRKRTGLFAAFVKPKTWAYAAALITLLASVWLIRKQTMSVPEAPMASVELSEEDIESYLIDNARDFEPDQLASISPAEPETRELENAPAPHAAGEKHKTIRHEELRPEDVEEILDDMTDEELEKML